MTRLQIAEGRHPIWLGISNPLGSKCYSVLECIEKGVTWSGDRALNEDVPVTKFLFDSSGACARLDLAEPTKGVNDLGCENTSKKYLFVCVADCSEGSRCASLEDSEDLVSVVWDNGEGTVGYV